MHTFACLLLLFKVDEQEARALGAEGQQDALQHSRGHSEGQQQGPQLGWAQQRLQTKDLNTKDHISWIPIKDKILTTKCTAANCITQEELVLISRFLSNKSKAVGWLNVGFVRKPPADLRDQDAHHHAELVKSAEGSSEGSGWHLTHVHGSQAGKKAAEQADDQATGDHHLIGGADGGEAHEEATDHR